MKNKTELNRLNSIVVNNRNGIIFVSIQGKNGLQSLRFNQTAKAFETLNHVNDNALSKPV